MRERNCDSQDKKMIFICNDNTDARFNLAVEEALFEEAQTKGSEFVSVWQNAPAVIVGRYQNTAEEVNQEFIKKNAVKTVRRITGGGAVYHDLGNLNYTIIKKIEKNKENVEFSEFAHIIAGSLGLLGLPALVSGRNDILLGGKKISGHAQHIAKNTLLHHGTLLFDSNLENLAAALNAGCEKFVSKAVKSVRDRVANIKTFLGSESEFSDIKNFCSFLREKLAEKFNVSVSKIRELSEKEMKRAAFLVRKKYSAWDWNWGASPPFTSVLSRRFDGGLVEFFLDVENGIIKNCEIRGDFFSYLSLECLTKKFCGLKYPLGASQLDGLDFHAAFIGIAAEEIRKLLLSENTLKGV